MNSPRSHAHVMLEDARDRLARTETKGIFDLNVQIHLRSGATLSRVSLIGSIHDGVVAILHDYDTEPRNALVVANDIVMVSYVEG